MHVHIYTCAMQVWATKSCISSGQPWQNTYPYTVHKQTCDSSAHEFNFLFILSLFPSSVSSFLSSLHSSHNSLPSCTLFSLFLSSFLSFFLPLTLFFYQWSSPDRQYCWWQTQSRPLPAHPQASSPEDCYRKTYQKMKSIILLGTQSLVLDKHEPQIRFGP